MVRTSLKEIRQVLEFVLVQVLWVIVVTAPSTDWTCTLSWLPALLVWWYFFQYRLGGKVSLNSLGWGKLPHLKLWGHCSPPWALWSLQWATLSLSLKLEGPGPA